MQRKRLAVLLVIVLAGLGCFAIVNSQPTTTPTYYSHIEQIISNNCLGCHITGGIATFSLEKPETVQRLASGIKYAVENNLMPPWPPSPETPAMHNERKLKPEDKTTLLAWINSGAPLGDLSQRPATTPAQAPPAPKPDRLVAMDTAYTPNRALTDDYRCFLIDPKIESDTFVTSYGITPGLKNVVHHVVLYTLPSEYVEMAQEHDRAEEGPGWTCFGGPGVMGAGSFLDGNIGFWVPGTIGTVFPEGTGRFVKAGTHIIMQMHYSIANLRANESDVTQASLGLARDKTQLATLSDFLLVAPVEIRCPGDYPTDPKNPCNRVYAMERTTMSREANSIHRQCRTTVDYFQTRHVGDGSKQEMNCTYPVRSDSLALGVLLHLHLRGTITQIILNPDTPSAKVLLQIPRWDFYWQGEYWFKEPIALKAGDRLKISCTYDNSGPISGPDKKPIEPRYITWGENTTDEMCVGGVTFVSK
jgi:hypothetical protein